MAPKFKSKEFVSESDDESVDRGLALESKSASSERNRASSKPQEKLPASKLSKSSTKLVKSKPTPIPPKPTAPAKRKEFGETTHGKTKILKSKAAKRKRLGDDAVSSSGTDSESSSGSEEESNLEDKRAPKAKANGVAPGKQQKQKASSREERSGSKSGSSEASSDEASGGDGESAQSGSEINGVKKSKTSSETGDDSESSSQSDGDGRLENGGTASTAGSEDSDTGSESDREEAEDPRPSKRARVESLPPFPVIPYSPGAGFAEETYSDTSGTISQLRGSCNGRTQLWHIAVPPSFTQSDLQKVDWQKALGGAPLKHNDGDYKFSTQSNKTQESCVVLPSREGYTVAAGISRSVCLQKVPQIPTIPSKPRAQPPVKQKRPQPKGLRLRFRPIGDVDPSSHVDGDAVNGTEGDVLDAAPARAVFHAPRPLPDEHEQGQPKKRKRDETEEERAARKAAKRAKKEAKLSARKGAKEPSPKSRDQAQTEDKEKKRKHKHKH